MYKQINIGDRVRVAEFTQEERFENLEPDYT